ncbi:MAG TPA: phosphoribosyltransferase family protein, partial [Oscillospiraceae bacterium]|nr:phosphoribosyltransferase family protein [Oscillospiraceae bacterium]
SLSAERRCTNLIGAFRASGNLSGLKILLADDILTSGNTAWFCAEALKKAGAAEVYVVTAAVTKPESEKGFSRR